MIHGYLLIACLIAGVYIYLAKFYRQIVLALKLPGPRAYPLIGNFGIVRSNTAIKELSGSSSKYGTLGRFWLSIVPFFVILSPQEIQTILSSKMHIDKSPFYNIMKSYMGNSIVLANGDEWYAKRKLLNQFFQMKVLENLFEYMVEGGKHLCDILERTKEGVNITGYLNNCVDQTLNSAILGIPIKQDTSKEVNCFRKRRNMMYTRINQPWLAFDCIFNLTKTAVDEKKHHEDFFQMIKKNVELRRRKMKEGSVERECILDLLIKVQDENPKFSLQDIVTEAFTLLITASDTTSASLVYAIFLLAKHPEALQKCFEEQEHIRAEFGDSISVNELRQMKYLEMCISESLRLYPVLPLIGRSLKEDVQVGDVIVPSGSEVLIPIYELHRVESIFPDPEKFDPERFSAENSAKRHAYSYIPFSSGVRNCSGQKFAMFQMKIILSQVIRRFSLEIVKGKETLNPRYKILLYAHGGVWVKFNKRSVPQ